MEIKREQIKNFLEEVFSKKIEIIDVAPIGSVEDQGMKELGYGKPLLIKFKCGESRKEVVLSSMREDKYGHQFYWDRASVLLFQYETGKKIPRHVKPVAVGYISKRGEIYPVKEPYDFFILNEKVEGKEYFLHLERIQKGEFYDEDIKLAKKFAVWLADLHKRKKEDSDLYKRRIRDLIGHSECIWGIIDGYPYPYDFYPKDKFISLEKKLIDWRWKLNTNFTHRLSAVHGDFHPWNILVEDNGDFWLLDCSRGEWGEPADDVSTLSCNYLLFSLYPYGKLDGPFERLYMSFWEEYLSLTGDEEILEVIGPFYVFRALVIASPEWYPNHPERVRRALFNFIENVLEEEKFDYKSINKYLDL